MQFCTTKELSRNVVRLPTHKNEQSEIDTTRDIGGKIIGGTNVTDDKKHPYFVRIRVSNAYFGGI